jgi:hypothetical protein
VWRATTGGGSFAFVHGKRTLIQVNPSDLDVQRLEALSLSTCMLLPAAEDLSVNYIAAFHKPLEPSALV